MCTGFCWLEVDPSPKSQSQLVGLFVVWSVNVTLPPQVLFVFTVKSVAGGH